MTNVPVMLYFENFSMIQTSTYPHCNSDCIDGSYAVESISKLISQGIDLVYFTHLQFLFQ